MPWPTERDGKTPIGVFFMHVAGCEREAGGGIWNADEVAAMEAVVNWLGSNHFEWTKLGILAMYNGQVSELRERLGDRLPAAAGTERSTTLAAFREISTAHALPCPEHAVYSLGAESMVPILRLLLKAKAGFDDHEQICLCTHHGCYGSLEFTVGIIEFCVRLRNVFAASTAVCLMQVLRILLLLASSLLHFTNTARTSNEDLGFDSGRPSTAMASSSFFVAMWFRRFMSRIT